MFTSMENVVKPDNKFLNSKKRMRENTAGFCPAGQKPASEKMLARTRFTPEQQAGPVAATSR
jgi:hypothetical protein